MTNEAGRMESELEFYHDMDRALKRANLPLSVMHQVLDQMGAPEGNGTDPTTVAQRFRWLMGKQALREQERVEIGCNFDRNPTWKFLLGVPLIYIPLLVGIPAVAVTALLVRTHLRMVGGHKLKSYWQDFVPSWVSHRYTRQNQIVSDKLSQKFGVLANVAKSKFFWIFNCKLYCPLSVALLAYLLYLAKIVEQWWCPFKHDKKATYADAPIDQSFWHADGDSGLMHPDDRENPSWNENAR